jgi:hybrid cluster-associated redox disulfide protein
MAGGAIIDLSVGEIMSTWPSTIRVFIAHRMHCVGCPIAPFHTLADAAEEHRIGLDELVGDVEAEIERATAGT